MGLQPKELNKIIAVLGNDCLVKMLVLSNSHMLPMHLILETAIARMNLERVLRDLLGSSTTISTTNTFAMLSSGVCRR
jgi:hypothetical protein